MEANQNLAPNAGISDGLGRCFHALGDYDKAIYDFEKAIENAVNTQEKRTFLLHKAQCEFDQSKLTETQFEKSIEDLEKGLDLEMY